MVVVSAMYPNRAGSRFDRKYYLEKRTPLLKQLWSGMGLQNVQLLRGVGTPDGTEPAYQVMALLTFSSLEKFQEAAAAHAAEVFADIPNFTDVQPVVQISQELS